MTLKDVTLEDVTLGDRLRARIAKAGPIGVDDFMTACLWDETHGYYRRAEVFGAGGDFITAPEISQVFGELIGLWAAVVWAAIGRPAPLRLVELGPGRGTLMADALRAIAAAMPECFEAVRVHLVERSAGLAAEQRARLRDAGVPISRHEDCGDIPPGPTILVANEFLDALPIRQFVHVVGCWHERRVGLGEGGRLAFVSGPVQDTPPPGMHGWPDGARDGDILETRALADLVTALCRRATNAPLMALFIDYGHAESWGHAEPRSHAENRDEESHLGESLQAVRGHHYASPLEWPGEADLSAHVDFAVLARTARNAGLEADGPMTQAEFLGALGIAERAARLMQTASPREAHLIEAAIARLLAPQGMGGRFKVMALRGPETPPQLPLDLH